MNGEVNYTYPLYRPPAEANNIIIQATHGCSYNNCSFCSMYKTKSYKVKDLQDVYQDIDVISKNYPDAHKIFLADGDALSLKTEHLIDILKYLQKSFSRLKRVSVYGSAQNILDKTQEELELLYENKLNLIYYGIETGSDTILKKITKGVDQKEIIESLNKVSKSGIKISATVILGLGGELYSNEHIEETAKLVNATTLNYLATLQLGIDDDARDNFYKHFNDFNALNDYQILDEQKKFIQLLNPSNKIIFRSNHASNALHLAGTLPKDKQKLLNEIDRALSVGDDALVPSIYRGF